MNKARLTRELKDFADSIGCKVVRLKSYDGRNSERIGIHILRPTQQELEHALQTAKRDMFPAIYIHTFDSWTPGCMPRRALKAVKS